MKKDILLRTNILVCLILIVGFTLTSMLSYNANYKTSLRDIEHITDLTSEGIYYQISDTFTKPVNVSLTMAHDSLLWRFLREESGQREDASFNGKMREYLNTYRVEHGYDSVFLVSAGTERYYNFNGMDRVLTRDNPENGWYYEMMENGGDYAINVDNDEVQGAQNRITVFVNCKIPDGFGGTLGVVGVGLRSDNFQELLRSYEEEFGVSAYLINEEGLIEISTEFTGYEKVGFFEQYDFADSIRDEILDCDAEGNARGLWTNDKEGSNYIVTRFIPELQWHLVVERNTGTLLTQMRRQLFLTVLIIMMLIIGVLFIITCVIRSYNGQIIDLTRTIERERHAVFEKTTGRLFENIYEIDITHNCSANQASGEYFESLGAAADMPFDKALHMIAEKQIKAEFRQGYIDTFSPDNVMRAFEAGKDSLQYDLMISEDNEKYHWTRIIGGIVRWGNDGPLHMLVYRQNIHEEKEREKKLQELMQTDEMTGLLTKTATQRQIEKALLDPSRVAAAFFIIDIDHFKEANDQFGHAFGDSIIRVFADGLQRGFPDGDIIGRLGGDEFGVFAAVRDRGEAAEKAEGLLKVLNRRYCEDEKCWRVMASIGIAMAPDDGTGFDALYKKADQALYQVKERGRNGFCFYGSLEGERGGQDTERRDGNGKL